MRKGPPFFFRHPRESGDPEPGGQGCVTLDPRVRGDDGLGSRPYLSLRWLICSDPRTRNR
ncbi:MAG: hypothetical protein EOP60_12985 [Sphingomonadales bacterium]|nr:MAG: hypothetical protein EOP60_12985 [Sphingomonadales bacterium]